ncbi:Histone deacetylase complex subunit [Collariella sp. IMI 366227]|nr:Histone deacetylase complex subunit [Collariella sp. IMI 366227]
MAEDPFGTRRRTRGQVEEKERAGAKTEATDVANGDGDVQEEDEAVRCVCGNEEYQGPPPFEEDSKHGFKHFDLDPFFSADVTDDTAGLFVQCDVCKVWHHGGCVGIMTEESSPDESVYSHYLPLKRHARTASRSVSLNKEAARSPIKEKETRSGRNSTANQHGKRRSTLNSREAGYDEAEALRRAIEASKVEAVSEPAENGNRRPKRGRSDSNAKLENIKRQKTSSRSASPSSDKNAEDSDDAVVTGRNGASKSKRGGAATRNQRAEKAAEKEERERQRAETANKRRGRADRRRAEGMTNTPPTATVQSKADKKRSHKKKGRNQYTREEESPARSLSRDTQKDEHSAPSTGKLGEGTGKANSKTRGGMNSKITLNDMKRRATALLDFISRTQVELAGESLPEAAGTANSTAGSAAAASDKAPNGVDLTPMLVAGEVPEASQGKDFKELGCIEMMDTLTRRLVKWQQQYAV